MIEALSEVVWSKPACTCEWDLCTNKSQITVHILIIYIAQLHYLSNCICPGYVITYECTVFGDGYTVWRGSAFDCPLSGNEILLSHNNFEDGTTRICNNGAIVGRSVRIMDNYYTSQLAVSFTTRLDGRTIECMRIGGTASAVTIGSSVLLTTTGLFFP